jgi:hypothetical protein
VIESPSKNNDAKTIHEKCGVSVDSILHTSAFKKTFDNITAVMVAFENFENLASEIKGGDNF